MQSNIDIETRCNYNTNHKHVATFMVEIGTKRLWTTTDGYIKCNFDSTDRKYNVMKDMILDVIRHFIDNFVDNSYKIGTEKNPIIRGRLMKQIPEKSKTFSCTDKWI